MRAGFSPAVLLDDDVHYKTHQRPDIRCDKSVGPDDVDHAPAGGQRCAHLANPPVPGACRSIDPLTQGNLLREGNKAQRIVDPIHGLVSARRRSRRRSFGRIQQLQRPSRALDRLLADFIGVRERRGLAGYAAKTEPRAAVIISSLQPAVVEAERLAGAVLKVKFAVIVAGKMPGGETPRAIWVQAPVQEPPGIGHSHADLRSAGPPSRTKRRSQ